MNNEKLQNKIVKAKYRLELMKKGAILCPLILFVALAIMVFATQNNQAESRENETVNYYVSDETTKYLEETNRLQTVMLAIATFLTTSYVGMGIGLVFTTVFPWFFAVGGAIGIFYKLFEMDVQSAMGWAVKVSATGIVLFAIIFAFIATILLGIAVSLLVVPFLATHDVYHVHGKKPAIIVGLLFLPILALTSFWIIPIILN